MASITPKGSAWEWSKSLWMIWTLFFGMLTWISFLYIAYRTKQRKWALWGLVYAAACAYCIMFLEPQYENTFWGEMWVVVLVVTWIGGMFHAWKVRKEYLLRLVALSKLQDTHKETLKNQIELEYNVDIDEEPASKQTEKAAVQEPQAPQAVEAQTAAAAPAAPAATDPSEPDDDIAEVTRPSLRPPSAVLAPPEGPVDINNDSKERIAALPKVGIVLAMKAVSVRETQGGFATVEEFVAAVGLKPHVADLLRDHIVIRPIR